MEAAAAAALARQKFVTPVDVCVGIGWLQASNLEDWRRGRVDDLEHFLPVHDDRLIDLIMYLHEWAQARGLTRIDTDYVLSHQGSASAAFLHQWGADRGGRLAVAVDFR